MFEDVTLGQFLMLFVSTNQHDHDEICRFNMINTNNDTFPEKYRYTFITAASFWAEIYRNGDPDKLFDREIDFIGLLPNHINLEEGFKYELMWDVNEGFMTPLIDEETGNKVIDEESGEVVMNHLAPVIYIVLEKEENEISK